MKYYFSILGKTVLLPACIMMMLTAFGQNDPYSQGFTNFEFQDDTILKFTTKPIVVDPLRCYFVLENDTSVFNWPIINRQSNTMKKKWQIPWKDGEHKLEIILRDTAGGECICDTIIEHKHFCYWIVSVGTGDKQKIGELPCSSEDAETFEKVVENTIGLKPEISVCLTGVNATKKNILHVADSVGKDIGVKKKNKVFGRMAVFVYLGGHGMRDKNKEFFFQVNDEDGIGVPYSSGEWLSETEIAGFGFLKQMEYEDNADVWFFVDACESIKQDGSPLEQRIYSITSNDSNEQKEKSCGFSFNYYSSVITSGERFKTKDSIMKEGDYCNDIKEVDSLLNVVDKVEKGGSNNLKNKAIHGLYLNFFKRTFEEANQPIDCDAFQEKMNGRYNKYLTTKNQYGKNDPKPSVPVNKIYENPLISYCSLDLAIGWNLSKQWNPQIGFSWKKWSVFAECSFNGNWTDSITHVLGNERIIDTIRSKYTVGAGLGFRVYPISIKKVDIGFSLSAQTGRIYGEKIVSEAETIKHSQAYWSLAPAASLRWFTSKNHRYMCYFNVGYVFYFPCTINSDMKWRSAVTNLGISIPIL